MTYKNYTIVKNIAGKYYIEDDKGNAGHFIGHPGGVQSIRIIKNLIDKIDTVKIKWIYFNDK